MPDALPVLGLAEDAAVVSACLALVEQDLYAYRDWYRKHGTIRKGKICSENESYES